MIAALPDWVQTAPWAFLVGVIVGLGLASRYRIVRVREQQRDQDRV
jgi:hypothetical protein